MKPRCQIKSSLHLIVAILCGALLPHPWIFRLGAQDWVAQGPGPITGGQVEGMGPQNNPVAGAIHAVLPHPTDANTIYVGSVNGGVWKTTDGGVNWTPLTDSQTSLSIGALAFDPTDPTSNTLVAGLGRFSSFSQNGGLENGILRSTDGGLSWTRLTHPNFLNNERVSGIVARGNTIVASLTINDPGGNSHFGIVRSTDGGTTFSKMSLVSGSGLPNGVCYDLAADPGNLNVLYTNVWIGGSGGTSGIFKSTDMGATWSRVSDAAMNSLLDSTQNTNVEIAVGNANNVYAGVINNGQLAGLFRSGDGGGTWAQLDTPTTNENGTTVGIQPNPHPGAQGMIHFSIVADPGDPNIVYVGGDRQPFNNGPNTGTFPNSLGANDTTGRLFRVNAALPAGSQAISLTHQQGISTVSNSAPHADSRDMAFNALGQLIEGDDGGIYLRSNPQGLGDWMSLNGNIRTTEIHSIAWDRNTNTLIGGTQDVATVEQVTPGGTAWRSLGKGDGGRVVIDAHLSGQSVRYSSSQFLGEFRRRVIDPTTNTVLSETLPALNIANPPPLISNIKNDPGRQFLTTVVGNRFDERIYIATQRIYESSDGGENFTNLTPNAVAAVVTSLEAGGMFGGVPNPDVLYAGTAEPFGSSARVYRRTTAGGDVTRVAGYVGGEVRDLVMDDENWMSVYVADNNEVFRSADAGDTFSNITFNLAMKLTDIRTLEFISANALGFDIVVAGGLEGVFYALTSNLSNWFELGALPNAPVFDLFYDPLDDVLVAATLGRGAFTLAHASLNIPEPGALLLALAGGTMVLLQRRRLIF
jgi:photosystem II stability/assembly factor-like uncharacterized protein